MLLRWTGVRYEFCSLIWIRWVLMEIMERPFCGESSENSLIVTDSRRQNLALNKRGKLHK